MSNRSDYFFTSESVSEGHPDKVCDRISDAVLDAFLTEHSESRVACETFATTDRVVVGGEVRGPEGVLGRIEEIVRDVVRDIGYAQKGFNWETLRVHNYIHGQSEHIAQGVDGSDDKEEGAGDQGIMFGYAVDDTPELMPAPIHYSHAVLHRLADARKSGAEPRLGPDAKAQLSLRYAGGKPVEVSCFVLSTQHLDEDMDSAAVREMVEPYVREVIPEGWLTDNTIWHVNPTGKFVIGGPDGDAGLTGRKIIVDTYGGAAPHGGGAFSGKDPTKVDRSAAYAARYLAKNVVASGLATRCVLQLSYAIGVARPLSIYADTFGTGEVSEAAIEKAVAEVMDLTPKGIRTHLGLNRPIYQRTSAYGHFGRAPDNEGGFSWETHRPGRGPQKGGVSGGPVTARDTRPPDRGEGAARPWRNLYGRRRGKKLRASQVRLLEELLPRLRIAGVTPADNPERRPLDRRALFGDARALWLEVGFGGGEHLAAQAEAHPQIGLIGCEPYVNGVAMALARLDAAGVGNVRLHPGDARDLIELLPDEALDRVFLLYPDPWPKARHHRRRFASPDNLGLLYRAMAPGAELRLATDIPEYAEHAREAVAATPGFRLEADGAVPWSGWPGTRYEAKALVAGRHPRYLTIVRA